MPAAREVMTPTQAIESAIASGRIQAGQLLPPVEPNARSALLPFLPGPLPPEIDALWARCAGIKTEPEPIGFTPEPDGMRLHLDECIALLRESGKQVPEAMLQAGREASTSRIGPSVHLVNDACGNHWEVEIGADGQWGPVWFLCHDPAVFTIAAPDLGAFLHVGFSNSDDEMYGSWPTGDDMTIWSRNPDARPSEVLFDSEDELLREYARSLGDGWDIFDMREGRVGSGYPWGRYGAPEDVQRHKESRVFAARRLSPKRSFWNWLIGNRPS